MKPISEKKETFFTLSQDPVSPESEDLAELKTTLELMQDALDKAIIDFEQIDSSR